MGEFANRVDADVLRATASMGSIETGRCVAAEFSLYKSSDAGTCANSANTAKAIRVSWRAATAQNWNSGIRSTQLNDVGSQKRRRNYWYG